MKRWLAGGLAAAGVAAVLAATPPNARAQGAAPSFRKRAVAFGQATGSVAVGDFNADGKLDVAAASSEEIAWYERSGGRSFWGKHPVHTRTDETGPLGATGLLAYDLDGDLDLDLVSLSEQSGALSWYENPGLTANPDPVADLAPSAKKEWKWRLIDTLPGLRALALEDLTRDNRPELVAAHEGSIVWYLLPAEIGAALPASYRGDPGVRPHWERRYLARSGASGEVRSLLFADLDGDGDRDLCAAASKAGTLAWWERPADGTLVWSKHLIRGGLPGASQCLLADINGDGKPDLVYARGGAKGIGWLSGPEWLSEQIIDDGWLEGPRAMAVADLDGDGKPDVIAASRDNARTAWWRNDGKGNFSREPLDIAQAGSDLRVVDVDGDGDLDILVAGGDSKNVAWYENLKN